MSVKDVSKDLESSVAPAVNPNRREVLIALGVGMTVPLFGCGGGGGGGAAVVTPIHADTATTDTTGSATTATDDADSHF